MKQLKLWLLLGLFTVQTSAAEAFSTDGGKYPNARTTLSLNRTSFPPGNIFNLNAQFAMSDWNAVVGSNFRFFVNSTNCNTGISLATSDNCVGFRPAATVSGALAVTRTVTLFGRRLNADVQFNRDVTWTPGVNVGDFSFGPPFSFRGVARHEFGHVFGLCHEDRPSNVVLMNSRYTAGGVKPANPHADDRFGVRSLYRGNGTERELIAYMWKKTTNGGASCASAAASSTPVSRPAPATVSRGGTVTMEYSFENAGNLNSGTFNVAFLLSTDRTIRNNDLRIGTNIGASAPPHSRGTFTRSLRIPRNAGTGTRYLGICLDPAGSVTETSRGNNCAVAPGTIVVR